MEKSERRLQPWEEVRGELQAIETTEDVVRIELSTDTVALVRSTRGVNPVLQELKGEEGAMISLLRTDLPDRPFVVTIESRS